ncbi:uncharacterized protein LOC122089787 [Macadamia integrifolia]|uniref:uncharacterized protein LOC122089787 n=1 Tax=Macadamia integrifolia TaxID=60698 RepID=UPI001C4EC354|nr:uncharacterized protein LOC122089787 [Macadamia integrifolia]
MVCDPLSFGSEYDVSDWWTPEVEEHDQECACDHYAYAASGIDQKAASPIIVLKVDLHKAYDSLTKKFLFEVMEKMGFPDKFLGWIKACVSTPMFSVLINGNPTGYFSGGQCIRQGDPLSPYLFTLAMEVFSGEYGLDLPWIKLNIDGCSLGNPGKAGTGGVFRNENAEVILNFRDVIRVKSNFEAKIMAVISGLEHARSIKDQKLWIESESVAVVTLLSRGFVP